MTRFQEAFDHLDHYIARHMDQGQIPGLALALTDRTHLIHTTCYGLADVSAQTPVTNETLFEIGSIGKSFTSMALLQQVEAGRLDLHAPVTTYLPWFQIQSAYAPITAHHLMSHTAGLINGSDLAPHGHYEVWALRQTETGSPPGSHFHYSNVGYKALGYLLEALLGQRYEAILQAQILGPLGMTATQPAITPATRTRLAQGYRRFEDDRPRYAGQPLTPATWHEYAGADGSLASTTTDMATYLRLLLNRGQGSARRILTEASFALMTQPVIKAWGDTSYGYGLTLTESDGFPHLGHSGGTLGFSSLILADLENGLGVVILMNILADGYGIGNLALRILRAARAGRDLPDLPPVADATRIDHAADYTATYRRGDKILSVVAQAEGLILRHGDQQVVLEQRGPDRFYANQPDFNLFPLRFGRDDQGQVVELCHGPEWYRNDHYQGPTTFSTPPDWATYVGHYRSHNPWRSNFRIVLRKGTLLFIEPGGHETVLVPLEGAVFRVGEQAHCPERINFQAVVNGQALRAIFSGCAYDRTFTP